eukprot:2194690-Amphidinium_carterae.1
MCIRDRHDPVLEFDACMFGTDGVDDLRADPRNRLVTEAVMSVVRAGGLALEDTRGQPIGFFCGVSATSMHLLGMMSAMQTDVSVRPQSLFPMSTVALAHRQADIHATTGSNVAVDTDDSSSMTAVDAAVESLRVGRSVPCAVAVSCHHISSPFELVFLCGGGFLSRSGRSK